MAKKKRKKKRKNENSRVGANVAPRGFDYGCPRYAMAVGSFGFPTHLSAASIDGVAYGSVWSKEVDQLVPTISLVGQHGEELAKAFEEFNAWSKMTDPDSLELAFVFRKSGGYVLAISPEYSRLQRRCLGFDRTFTPIAAAATWFKQIDSVNPLLLKFRKYCSEPIAPFSFDGVIYTGLRSGLKTSSIPPLRPIPDLKSLLKFEVEFIDEESVKPNTLGDMALNAQSRPHLESKGPPRPEPGDISKLRVSTLLRHFPVTLERMRRNGFVLKCVCELAAEGVRAWQVEQAFCNLVLSSDMNGSAHFIKLSTDKIESSILEAIRSRHEMASGEDVQTFDLETVRTQVVADGRALLNYLNKKSGNEVAAVQAALRSSSLLEAPTAAVEAPAENTQ
jgi:hypothetical protein